MNDERYRPTNLSQQACDEEFEVFTVKLVVEDVEHQSQALPLWRHGESRNDRKPIVAVVALEDRCLPFSVPRLADRG